jgi:hypothetical protein
MGWLILNFILLSILIEIHQSFNSEEESPLTGLLFVCLIGFAFFSIIGMEVQPEIVKKLLKKTAAIEAIIILLTSVVIIASRSAFKEKLLGILITLISLSTFLSCGKQSQFVNKSEFIGSWKVYSQKGSIQLPVKEPVSIRLKPNGVAEYFSKKWIPFGGWDLKKETHITENYYLSFPVENIIVPLFSDSKLRYLGRQDHCLLFRGLKDNYKFCKEHKED